jgi:hypothetical protein
VFGIPHDFRVAAIAAGVSRQRIENIEWQNTTVNRAAQFDDLLVRHERIAAAVKDEQWN